MNETDATVAEIETIDDTDVSPRKLASIQRITALTPIDGADFIVVASVLGWKCVVRKDEAQVGELGVYLELDSVTPEIPAFEFMRQRKFRVKTMRLKGQLSQGLMMPISTFPELAGLELNEGDDVTQLLGIKKFEIPHRHGATASKARGNFPPYVPKTDEIRIQSAPNLLIELAGLPYYISQKMDGTSATYLIDPHGEFHACSRNLSVKDEPESLYWQIARSYKLPELLAGPMAGLAIQGEICGPGIQKNRVGLKETHLFVFNLYHIKEARYLNMQEAVDTVKANGPLMVPIEEVGESFNYDLDTLLLKAEGNYAGTNNRREGIVIRPQTEVRTKNGFGDRLSFKCLSTSFLLKCEE